MDLQKHQAVLTALTELIRDEIESEDREKFARIERLCVIGKRLLLEGAQRAKDFQRQNTIITGPDFVCGPEDVDDGNADGGMMDQAGLFRQLFQVLGPTLQAQGETAKTRTREGWANELNELLRTQSMMKNDPQQAELLAKIETRITELTNRITAKDPHDLVPTNPLRRHPARDEAERNPPHDLRSLPPGADRDGRALPPGDEGHSPLEAVGYV